MNTALMQRNPILDPRVSSKLLAIAAEESRRHAKRSGDTCTRIEGDVKQDVDRSVAPHRYVKETRRVGGIPMIIKAIQSVFRNQELARAKASIDGPPIAVPKGWRSEMRFRGQRFEVLSANVYAGRSVTRLVSFRLILGGEVLPECLYEIAPEPAPVMDGMRAAIAEFVKVLRETPAHELRKQQLMQAKAAEDGRDDDHERETKEYWTRRAAAAFGDDSAGESTAPSGPIALLKDQLDRCVRDEVIDLASGARRFDWVHDDGEMLPVTFARCSFQHGDETVSFFFPKTGMWLDVTGPDMEMLLRAGCDATSSITGDFVVTSAA